MKTVRHWPVCVDPLLKFLRHVKITNGCWPWLGSKYPSGYGQFVMNGKHRYASRAIWILLYGDPKEKDICHKCDNPICVRPDHLFAGTKKQNMKDCRDKGRMFLGKLTPRQVEAIKRAKKMGARSSALATRYGVSRQTIFHVSTGRTWVKNV